jgi:hypothetical protein
VNWITRGDTTLSGGYRITRSVRGFEVWLFNAKQSGCVAREVQTLQEAKAVAEKHKAEVSIPV